MPWVVVYTRAYVEKRLFYLLVAISVPYLNDVVTMLSWPLDNNVFEPMIFLKNQIGLGYLAARTNQFYVKKDRVLFVPTTEYSV